MMLSAVKNETTRNLHKILNWQSMYFPSSSSLEQKVELTRARILGSTATTSDRHFMAFVLTAMALSPSTLRICAWERTREVKQTPTISPKHLHQKKNNNLLVINKYQSSVQTASWRPDIWRSDRNPRSRLSTTWRKQLIHYRGRRGEQPREK